MPIADLVPYQFTKDTGPIMAQRSAEVRRERSIKLNPRPHPYRIPSNAERAISAQLAIVSEQIKLTRNVLNQETIEHHHRAQLLKALNTLLDRQRILLNVPSPGTLKPERAMKRAQVWAEPEPVSTPQQVATCVCDDPSI